MIDIQTPSQIQIKVKTEVFVPETNMSTPPTVNISPENILEIAKTVKTLIINDLNTIVEEKQKPILEEISALKTKNQDLERKLNDIVYNTERERISYEPNEELKKEIKFLKVKCDDLEQHSRKQLVRITGVPYTLVRIQIEKFSS